MSYGGYNKEVTEKSKRLERIDKILTNLNIAWVSPMGKDMITGRDYFEIIISMLEVLSNEIFPDLSDQEVKKEKEKREAITKQIKEKPIYTSRKTRDGTLVTKDITNWEELKPLLFEYDRQLRGWCSTNLKQQIYGEGPEDDVAYVNADGTMGDAPEDD